MGGIAIKGAGVGVGTLPGLIVAVVLGPTHERCAVCGVRAVCGG